MPAPEIIQQLVARFNDQRSAYQSGKYNETQLRRDFLDPFFEALGWDVTNRKNYSEKYREVVHEVSLEVDGGAKAADYAFQSGGHVHFFVEAKKPAVNIETHPDSAFQIRRYGWSAKLNVSVLSDFEQLAVYDCRQKPVHGDPAHVGRANLYSFTEYLDKWDEIAGLLSYDAVHQGSLEKFTDSLKGKRGTADVDDAFLAEMEHWREELARVIALRNIKLTQREINTAVQLIIDRIIFLRICEDRGIEPENGLRDATDGIDVYGDLMELFKKADKKYNSGLFHFGAEKGQSSFPDTLTPTLKIDDKVFKDILANLYLPKSPYAFKYFSAEILGQVYERFLGKVIRLTAGGHAKVEEKPEVRKAGGVYYTPTYIVDYIVKNTVGELLKDKTPADLFLEPIRIVDPACGSGSFLLGAYQYLMDWTLNWYMANDPAKWAKGKTPPIFEGDQSWQLTMEKKKELLTSHIFGVDIDSQAVEVTKLSLLLKVVENPGQLSLLGERILPDLGENIKCGNSLIGPDYYDNQQLTMFDTEEQYRVNAFDWKNEFKKIKFNAVIGNPPYIGFQGFDENKDYLRAKYISAVGRFDIYLPFLEKGIGLLGQDGLLGFICPTNFSKRSYGKEIRTLIRTTTKIEKFIDFEDVQIFNGAINYTGIFILRKSLPDNSNKFYYSSRSLDDEGFYIEQSSLGEENWIIRVEESSSIISTINNQKKQFLEDIALEISEGIVTGKNDVFLLDKEKAKEMQLEGDLLRPCIRGRQIRKYFIDEISETVIYPYENFGGGTKVIPPSRMEKDFSKIWEYLKANKKALSGRSYFEKSSKNWYELWCQRSMKSQESIKILVPELADSNRFCIDERNSYFGDTVCGILFSPDSEFSIYYILGLLNSKLLDYFYKKTTVPKANQFYIYKPMYLKKIPIRSIDFSDPAEVAHHDRMVALVENMLALHKQSATARLPDEKERLARQIESTDRQIDKLVYDLYGLTPDEIKIVEGTS